MDLKERITAPGPKKILTIDGGGIRGIIALEVLARIESILRKKSGRNNLVLCDYFDFFAGTSTGAIIAAALAMKWPVDKLRKFYLEQGANMFDSASIFERYKFRYDGDNLEGMLQKEFGAATALGDVTGALLMMVMRNATTDSPWPVCNNPFAKYNQPQRRDPPHGDCNLDFPLWQLVRASTAAPTFFPPEVIRVGDKRFIFVDGGVSPYNNPSFQAFLLSTVEPYKINWEAGERNILLISVGTGLVPDANLRLAAGDMNLLYSASHLPSVLIGAAQIEQDLLCRVFGKCLAGDPIDREIGALIDARSPAQPKLFTYARYNTDLTAGALKSICLDNIDPAHVQKMDSVRYVGEMQEVGKAVAEVRVKEEHFASFF